MEPAGRRHIHVVELRIQHGVNINITNYNGRTALMFVADAGNQDVDEFLIQHIAYINVTNGVW